MPCKHIANSASSDAEKGTPCEAIEEARHEHGLGIPGHSAWDQPNQKEGK